MPDSLFVKRAGRDCFRMVWILTGNGSHCTIGGRAAKVTLGQPLVAIAPHPHVKAILEIRATFG
jgi:hypothetical protein